MRCNHAAVAVWVLVFLCHVGASRAEEPAPEIRTTIVLVNSPMEAALSEAAKAAMQVEYNRAAQELSWDKIEARDVVGVLSLGAADCDMMRAEFAAGLGLSSNQALFVQSANPAYYQRLEQEDVENYAFRTVFFPPGRLTIALIGTGEATPESVIVRALELLDQGDARVLPLPGPVVPQLVAPLSEEPKKEGEHEVEALPYICGSDDRLLTNDRRIGRMLPAVATGFLVERRVGLTAGHAVATQGNTLEFQVPPSQPNGALTPALPNDVYPVIETASENVMAGDDWAVMRFGRNSNTQRYPGDVQGPGFRLESVARPTRVTVTGYGVDDEPAKNQVQQTDTGVGQAHDAVYQAATNTRGSWWKYWVDTSAGTSGGPVYYEITPGKQVVVAIHTGGDGCIGQYANTGTAVDNADLRRAITRFVGRVPRVYIH